MQDCYTYYPFRAYPDSPNGERSLIWLAADDVSTDASNSDLGAVCCRLGASANQR
jgi:hypothetical protein